MIVIDCAQGSPEWLEARRGIPTASVFSDVLAKGKTANAESLVRAKLRATLALQRATGIVRQGFSSAATRQGTEREPEARSAFMVRSGELVQTVGFCRHDRLEAGASPDGLIGNDGALEIKSPEELAHLATLRSRRIPPEYVAQVQGVMWICARSWCRFVSWNPDFPPAQQLVIIDVPRDQLYIDRLAAEVEVFIDEVRGLAAELVLL